MHIAILGAGPIGLDAALAAHQAGMGFTVFEAADDVAANVRAWGHVRLFTPWSMNLSARMRARLGGRAPASDTECPTGQELVDRVLAPMADLPEVAERLRLGVRVVAASREGLVKSDEIGTGVRARYPFRLLVRDGTGERVEHADAVLDCTGTYANPNPVGDGGIPAPGELAHDHLIDRRIPDVHGSPERWAGMSVLVVGAGHSAQTVVSDLERLAARSPGTHVTWVVRRPVGAIERVPNDPLVARAELTDRSASLIDGASRHVTVRVGHVVDQLQSDGDGLVVILRDQRGVRMPFRADRVVALTGSVGDPSIYRQLQVHECWATSGPMKLAATLLGQTSADCLQQTSHGVDVLRSPEPQFYILGSKSYGRNNTFLLRVGYDQVEEVVSELASVSRREAEATEPASAGNTRT